MGAGISARGFSRGVRAGQRLNHLIAARIDGTGTAAILEGTNELTLVDNGTGDYTLTYATAYKRAPTIVVTPLGAAGDIIATLGTNSTTAVQILGWDGTDGTTAKDMDFHVLIVGSDAEDEV